MLNENGVGSDRDDSVDQLSLDLKRTKNTLPEFFESLLSFKWMQGVGFVKEI